MAVYQKDNPELLKKAILSAFDNSLPPLEMILVVDGPVDLTLKNTITNLKDRFKIRALYLKKNSGLANALNKGLKLVKTKWVARADADDINLPNRFEIQKKLADEGYSLIGGAIQEIDSFGRFLHIRKPPLRNTQIINFAKYRNPFNHMTIMYKLDDVLAVGGYPSLYLREDYALWAKMLSKGIPSINVQDVLVYATAGESMLKRRGGWVYAKNEVYLQQHLIACGIKGKFSGVMTGIVRAFIFIMPLFLRSFFYDFFLRVRK
jgi:glycosyltransferase involved in cell wall biosynthesis